MSDKTIYPTAGGTASAGDLSEPMARIIREELKVVGDEVRAEVRAQTQTRAVKMNAGATASALYGGGALTLAVGLLLALVLPGWAASLIVAVLLFGLAVVLRNAARGSGPGRGRAGVADPAAGADPARAAAGAPPVPPAPSNAGTPTAPGAPPVPPTAPPVPPASTPDPDPLAPHHRA